MRTLKPITLSLFASTLVLAACQARPTAAPATNVPLPTATARIVVVTATNPAGTAAPPTATAAAPTPAAPTATPAVTQAAPTQAASPVPPTATVPPTPDPNERVGAVLYQDSFDGSSRWNWGFEDEAAAFGLENGQLKAVGSQSGAYWRFTLGPDRLTNGDQQVTVAAHTVTCGPGDVFGLVFRAAPQAEADGAFDLYSFEVNCGGQARFESLSGSHATSIVGWTNTTAVNIGPNADNTLQVWMVGGDFRFYANGQYLFSAHDERLAAGTYGFYLQAAQPGLTVEFDNLVARSVVAGGM